MGTEDRGQRRCREPAPHAIALAWGAARSTRAPAGCSARAGVSGCPCDAPVVLTGEGSTLLFLGGAGLPRHPRYAPRCGTDPVFGILGSCPPHPSALKRPS